jgi:hypothetical protein
MVSRLFSLDQQEFESSVWMGTDGQASGPINEISRSHRRITKKTSSNLTGGSVTK